MKTFTAFISLILGLGAIVIGAMIGVKSEPVGGAVLVGAGVMICAASIQLLNSNTHENEKG